MGNCPNCGAPLGNEDNSCKYCGWVKPITTQVSSTETNILGEKKYCSSCGAQISIKAEICPKCGVRQKTTFSSILSETIEEEKMLKRTSSSKSRLTALLLCLFSFFIGAHRFYVGKGGSAIVMILLNFTGIGEIWATFDFINILCGNFKDGDGKKIVIW